jgi:acyl-homoserine lactone acylase PvdQ
MLRFAAAMAAAGGLTLVTGPGASADVQPYQANDGRGFFNILPPGSTGLDTAADVAKFQATGQRPPHNNEELGMYANLVYASPGLQRQDLEKYFKDASFGVKPGDVERTYSPRPDVTILRDKGFGVPHVYGKTRAGTMFGVGYAQAEDRLFLMDVFRRVGRGESASMVGGSAREFDHDVWEKAPYREDELQREFDLYDDRFGPEAKQIQEDVHNYVDGVNAYIDEAKIDPTKMPVEYAALGFPLGPEHFKPTDLVASGIVFGAILGTGGGEELKSALALEAARKRYGNKRGTRVWRDFREANDPESPLTIHSRRFPYQAPPRRLDKKSIALPDPGSVKPIPTAIGGPGETRPTSLGPNDRLFPKLPFDVKGMSNALLVSARESASGHPLAVFGPQTGYFAPQPLDDMDIHGPGIDARGATVLGTPYVVIGRGRDYAWSATSAGQDYEDTFALDLCEPNGARPTINSMYYRFRGGCYPIDVVEKKLSWTSNLVDPTPSGSETLHAERTALGLGEARATIKGKPVIYTRLRATFGHEVDRPALAVSAWDNADLIRNARDFQRQAYRMTYTFNWFYADSHDIAYMLGGSEPIRSKRVDRNLPIHGYRRYEWKNYDPVARTFAEESFRRHPKVINQNFITSWNNRQARDFRASDAQFSFGSIYRSQLLDDRIRRGIKGKRKMTLTQLIDAMEDAATVDLRGDKVLPWMLKVLGKPKDPALRTAKGGLEAWHRDGAHRLDRDHNGIYSHSDAIRIMDAWWPLWVDAQFKRPLGDTLWNRLLPLFEHGIDNDPNNDGIHRGSAYQGAVYGQVQKDLRAVLGKKVRGRYSRIYCGSGGKRRTRRAKLRECRSLARSTLKQALAADPKKLYEDPVCSSQPAIGPPDPGRKPGDQWCFDAIMHQAASALYQPLFHWVNRPTFQQAVEIQGPAPR